MLEKKTSRSVPHCGITLKARVDTKFECLRSVVEMAEGDASLARVNGSILLGDVDADEYLGALEEEFPGLKGVVANSEGNVLHFSSPLNYIEGIAELRYVDRIARTGVY